ncbi:hypothetical protein A3Q56_06670 [Intoshia linei]|uniref:HTH CENPB-type domain-containing protein n=1 Tax=Intoshia linei TaxID=1819745 RepID=A0A177AUE2_9BILA|nr:hypothetical protein A3Q56_06670 [Intoshia linei]
MIEKGNKILGPLKEGHCGRITIIRVDRGRLDPGNLIGVVTGVDHGQYTIGTSYGKSENNFTRNQIQKCDQQLINPEKSKPNFEFTFYCTRENPHCSQREISIKFKISLDTINRILSNKEKLLQIDDNRNKRQRKLSKTNAIDSTLFEWFVSRRHMYHSISGDNLKIMALKLAEFANIFNFCASTGWLNSFTNRYNIKSKFLIGESGFVPESLIDNFKPIYKNKLKKYNSDNTFNYDETDVYDALLSINQAWREVEYDDFQLLK